MAVSVAESSSNCTKFTFAFPNSGMTRGARVVAHVVFPASLTSLVCLLTSGGGRTEFGESIFAGSAIIVVSSRESLLMSTSILVPREVPEKPLMTV